MPSASFVVRTLLGVGRPRRRHGSRRRSRAPRPTPGGWPGTGRGRSPHRDRTRPRGRSPRSPLAGRPMSSAYSFTSAVLVDAGSSPHDEQPDSLSSRSRRLGRVRFGLEGDVHAVHMHQRRRDLEPQRVDGEVREDGLHVRAVVGWKRDGVRQDVVDGAAPGLSRVAAAADQRYAGFLDPYSSRRGATRRERPVVLQDTTRTWSAPTASSKLPRALKLASHHVGVLAALEERGRVVLLVEFVGSARRSPRAWRPPRRRSRDEFVHQSRRSMSRLQRTGRSGPRWRRRGHIRFATAPVRPRSSGASSRRPRRSMSGWSRTASATRLPMVP